MRAISRKDHMAAMTLGRSHRASHARSGDRPKLQQGQHPWSHSDIEIWKSSGIETAASHIYLQLHTCVSCTDSGIPLAGSLIVLSSK